MVFTIILKLFFGLFGLLLVARLLGKKTPVGNHTFRLDLYSRFRRNFRRVDLR